MKGTKKETYDTMLLIAIYAVIPFTVKRDFLNTSRE